MRVYAELRGCMLKAVQRRRTMWHVAGKDRQKCKSLFSYAVSLIACIIVIVFYYLLFGYFFYVRSNKEDLNAVVMANNNMMFFGCVLAYDDDVYINNYY